MLGFLASSISSISCFFVSSGFSFFSGFFFSVLGFGFKKSGYSSKTFSFKLSFVLHFFFSIDIVWYIAFGFLYPVISDNLFFAILGFLASSFSRVSCFLVSSVFPVLGLILKKSGHSSRTFAFNFSFVSHLFFNLFNAVIMLFCFLYSVSFTSSVPDIFGFLASSFSSVSWTVVSNGLACLGVVLKKSGYSSKIFSFNSSFVSHLFFSLFNAIRMLLGFLYSVSFTSSFPVMLGFLASSFSSVSCFLVSSVFPVLGLVLKKLGYNSKTFVFNFSFVLHLFFSALNTFLTLSGVL